MNGDELGALLQEACRTAGEVLRESVERAWSGHREGQYRFDLIVEGPVLDLLRGAGLGVLSEEAGEIDVDRGLVAVLDPVDGSTNAAHGLPWYATSICVVDADGPLQSIVFDHVSSTRFEARRGAGAWRDGDRLPPPRTTALADAVVGVNGVPPRSAGWAQFRALGAASLDLCAVADGRLDAYVDFDADAHGVWDYLGAALVCSEVGVPVIDAFDRDMCVLDHAARRTPVAGASPELLGELRRLRTLRISSD